MHLASQPQPCFYGMHIVVSPVKSHLADCSPPVTTRFVIKDACTASRKVLVRTQLCFVALLPRLRLYVHSSAQKQFAVQATLTAEVTYFFVVDGYNGAYGTWQFSLAALDNSTVEGSLLSGPYGLAVAGTSSVTTNSKLQPCSAVLTCSVLLAAETCVPICSTAFVVMTHSSLCFNDSL